MRVFLFCQNESVSEQLLQALHLRWPTLESSVFLQSLRGLRAVEQEEPELVMLFESLPDMDIWDTIGHIRVLSDVPIVVAARGGEEMDIARSLDAGADDYLRLPLDAMVIMARVVALLRRCFRTRQGDFGALIRLGELVIDPHSYEASIASAPLYLTPTEFKLLYLLAQYADETVSHADIRSAIWGDEVKAGKVLNKWVHRLRRKLGDDSRNPQWIKRVHRIGYRLAIPHSLSDDV